MFNLPFHIEPLPHQLYQFFIPQLPIHSTTSSRLYTVAAVFGLNVFAIG